MKNLHKTLILIIIFAMSAFVCACQTSKDNTKVVFTTGLSSDEVFRIDKASCTIPEIMVYLTNTQNQYQQKFGSDIWQTDWKGITLEDNIKETVLSRIAQIKTMNLMAKTYAVSLNTTEQAQVENAAKAYYNSLTADEIRLMNINPDTISKLYTEYALANKVYDYIIKDVNPEISDDEARTVSVSQIFIKTYTLDSNGNKVPYSDIARTDAFNRIKAISQQLKSGADFATMSEIYNEDVTPSFSIGKGSADMDVENIIFSLSNGDISDIIQTESGFMIVRCNSNFDKDQTAANKINIMNRLKKEVFNQEYEVFVGGLVKTLNEKVWNHITFIQDPSVKTNSFFAIYDEHLKGQS